MKKPIKRSEVARRAIEAFLENLREVETMESFKKLYPKEHDIKKAEKWAKKVEGIRMETHEAVAINRRLLLRTGGGHFVQIKDVSPELLLQVIQ